MKTFENWMYGVQNDLRPDNYAVPSQFRTAVLEMIDQISNLKPSQIEDMKDALLDLQKTLDDKLSGA